MTIRWMTNPVWRFNPLSLQGYLPPVRVLSESLEFLDVRIGTGRNETVLGHGPLRGHAIGYVGID